MKRHNQILGWIALALGFVAIPSFSLAADNLWFLSSGNIRPNVSTWGLQVPSISGSTQCLHVDTNGVFSGTGSDCASGSGTVTQINTSFPILGGPITTTGTLTFGGLSTSTPAVIGNLPYFSGPNTLANVATTSVSCSGSVSCTTFTAIGPSPITITATGGSSYPFTPNTNFSVGVSATSTPIWDTAGLFASSTSQFDYSSTTAAGIRSLYLTGLTSGRVPYLTTNGLVIDSSNLTFNGTTLTANTLNLSNALGILYGGTATTTFYNGGATFYNSTLGSLSQSSAISNFFWDETNKRLGLGTSTPGTLLSLGGTGTNTINLDNVATSTFGSGINLRTGCFSVNGTCVGGSAATPGGSDTQLQFNDGSTFGGASGLIWKKSTGFFGVGTTSPYSILSVSTTTQSSGNVFAVTGPESVTSQSVSGIATTTYTSSDTFIVPTGATSIDVYIVGGGGGSGGTNAADNSGGGGGSSAFGTYIIAGGGGGGGRRDDSCGANAAAGGGGGYAAKAGITVASIGGVGASIPIVVGTRGVFGGTAGTGYFNGGSVSDFNGGGGGGGGATAAGQSRGSNQNTGGAGGSFVGGGGGGVPNSGCSNGSGGASGTGAAGGAPAVGGQPGAGGGAASGGGGGGYATSTLSSVTFGYGGGGAAQNAGGAGGAGGGSVKGGDAGAANGGAGSGGGNGGDAGATGGAGGGFYSATYGKGSSLNSDNGTNGVVVVVVHGSPITQITGFKSIVASLSTLPAAGNGQSTTSTTTLSLGIGTTSPSALLSLESIGGQFSRMIGSMINGVHYVVEALDQFGHLVTGGKNPTCGTGCASVVGDDRNMRVVTGSSISAATVNFANTYTKTPICIANEESAGTVATDASSTPTTVVLDFASALTTKTIAVHCEISNNFTY